MGLFLLDCDVFVFCVIFVCDSLHTVARFHDNRDVH